MEKFDITFIGHICFDEIVPFNQPATITPGSAVLCGAAAAARVGKKVAVITRMAPEDEHILEPMHELGITTFVIPAQLTTYMKVVYPTADVDVREMAQVNNAGHFSIDEIPKIQSTHIHLAGITNQEFTLDFIEDLKKFDSNLSLDMQSFVRQVDPVSKRISLADVPEKKKIVKLGNKVKLDAVEASILTGTKDMDKVAAIFDDWGSKETLITRSGGVFVRVGHQTYFEKFTNTTNVGRTGRGDTTFAGYLAWRMNHNVRDSLRFSSAIASLKMETPGPFNGTLEEVLNRMNHNEVKH